MGKRGSIDEIIAVAKFTRGRLKFFADGNPVM